MDTTTLPGGKTALVEEFPLFSDVSQAGCVSIVSAAREKRFWRKQAIFSDGDPVEQVVVLLSGCVKITQIGPSGHEVILRLHGLGELVGAFCLSANGSRHYTTARAVQSSTALLWDAVTFEKLLERFPAFRRNAVRALEERLQETEQRLREVSTENVSSRLSNELVRLSNRFGYAVNGYREINLSHLELAQLTGTTISTVSRLLCRWQRLGIVNILREAVQVRDLAALAQLSQST